MAKKRTTVRFSEEVVKQISELAENYKKSNTDIIEFAIKALWFETFVLKLARWVPGLPKKSKRIYWVELEEGDEI
jgi:predicted transcriptional regulator